MNDDPLAYFITWTVYGTFLQGDERGWRKWRKGHQIPQLRLAEWRAERLKHSVILLEEPQRGAVNAEIHRLCTYRTWTCWAANARSNHVHVVITAPQYSGATVRDQLKANCTRVLRELSECWADRPVWTVGGDWECINTEDDLETVIACPGRTRSQILGIRRKPDANAFRLIFSPIAQKSLSQNCPVHPD